MENIFEVVRQLLNDTTRKTFTLVTEEGNKKINKNDFIDMKLESINNNDYIRINTLKGWKSCCIKRITEVLNGNTLYKSFTNDLVDTKELITSLVNDANKGIKTWVDYATSINFDGSFKELINHIDSNYEIYSLNNNTGVISKESTSVNDINLACELIDSNESFTLVSSDNSIKCELSKELYFEGKEFKIQNKEEVKPMNTIINETPINNKLCNEYTKEELIVICKENDIEININESKEYIFISIYKWLLEGEETCYNGSSELEYVNNTINDFSIENNKTNDNQINVLSENKVSELQQGKQILINNIEDINNINISDEQSYILFWYDSVLEEECKHSYKGKYINKLVNDFLQESEFKNIKIALMYEYFNNKYPENNQIKEEFDCDNTEVVVQDILNSNVNINTCDNENKQILINSIELSNRIDKIVSKGKEIIKYTNDYVIFKNKDIYVLRYFDECINDLTYNRIKEIKHSRISKDLNVLIELADKNKIELSEVTI